MAKRIGLTDLKFNVMLWDLSTDKPKVYNIFHNANVLRSCALYKTGKYAKFAKVITDSDWLHYCFGDLRSKVEYEFVFGYLFRDKDGNAIGEKTDVYAAYVEPNRHILQRMLDEVTVVSCKRYLAEERKRYKS